MAAMSMILEDPPAPSAQGARGTEDAAGAIRTPRRISPSGWITGLIAVGTGALYLWRLDAVGMGNSYYAAAVKSGSVSWKAWFFGAIDPGSFITVDKPPLSTWVMGLSARLFGFGSWSMLVPQALAGVASVLIVHHLVRRWMGDVAAHLAAIAFGLTPVALLMFRYNNPDAFLTLFCLAGAWALWTALEAGRTRWLVVSGALIGAAFLTKMLQAALVLPAFVFTYLWAAKTGWWRRIGQLAAGLAAMVVSAGWWVAVVALWPAASRPYIGSTDDNSILSLVLGYNGLSRIFGGEGPAGGPGGGSPGGVGGFGGAAGVWRMFNATNGGQISWLIPLAVAGLLAGLWLTRRAPRTDLARAGFLLWGGWTVVSLAIFSLSEGIFHEYYTVQVAPAIAALAAGGAVAMWRLGRAQRWLRWVLPVTMAATAAWAVALLDRTPEFHPWLRTAIVVGAASSTAGFFLAHLLRSRWALVGASGVAAVTLLAGPTAFALDTVRTPRTGSIVLAGPTTGGGFPGGGPGGVPGFGGASTTDSQLLDYLLEHRGDATYLVATFGSMSSAPIIIETGEPVITIGGFSGGDPAPTLEQFRQLVAAGKVRFVLLGGGPGGGPGGGVMTGGPGGLGGGPTGGRDGGIASWVRQHGTQVGDTSWNLYEVGQA
jgi:4-amino-4-deoxy-L-arabinose transferase-like glycosyltransferase